MSVTKDGTWRKKRSDVGKKREKRMDKSPRDIQFQGFAKALWDALVKANGYGYMDVNEHYDDGIDPTDYRGIIARRAYDFAYHVVEHTNPEICGEYDATESKMAFVPDMTELPKEKEQEGMYFIDNGDCHGAKALERLELPKEQD